MSASIALAPTLSLLLYSIAVNACGCGGGAGSCEVTTTLHPVSYTECADGYARANSTNNWCMRSDIVVSEVGDFVEFSANGCPDHPISQSVKRIGNSSCGAAGCCSSTTTGGCSSGCSSGGCCSSGSCSSSGGCASSSPTAITTGGGSCGGGCASYSPSVSPLGGCSTSAPAVGGGGACCSTQTPSASPVGGCCSTAAPTPAGCCGGSGCGSGCCGCTSSGAGCGGSCSCCCWGECGGGGCCSSGCASGCGCACATIGKYTPTYHDYRIRIPKSPRIATLPTPTRGNVVGVAVNGIPLFNDVTCNASVETCDSEAHRKFTKVFDSCTGHIDTGHRYHYHLLPLCLLRSLGVPTPDASDFWMTLVQEDGGGSTNYTRFWPRAAAVASPVIGWALDGFPIMGPYDENRTLVDNSTLDRCLGKLGLDGRYRYYASPEPPFFVGCFRGEKGNFTDTYIARTCPSDGIFSTKATKCSVSGPFFLFREDTFGTRWSSLFIISAIFNGVLFVFSAWRGLELHYESETRKLISVFLVFSCTLSQFLFYSIDPNGTTGKLPAVLLALLYGVQYWCTDGLLCMAVLKHLSYVAALEVTATELKACKSKKAKRSAMRRLMRGNRDLRRTMSSILNVDALDGSLASNPTLTKRRRRGRGKRFWEFEYSTTFFALLAVCFVVQTAADILRVFLDKNYWWLSVCRVIYLGAGYLLVMVFFASLLRVYSYAEIFEKQAWSKMQSFVMETCSVVITCVTISSLELWMLLDHSQTTSLRYYIASVVALFVRVTLYYLSLKRVVITDPEARAVNPFTQVVDSIFPNKVLNDDDSSKVSLASTKYSRRFQKNSASAIGGTSEKKRHNARQQSLRMGSMQQSLRMSQLLPRVHTSGVRTIDSVSKSTLSPEAGLKKEGAAIQKISILKMASSISSAKAASLSNRMPARESTVSFSDRSDQDEDQSQQKRHILTKFYSASLGTPSKIARTDRSAISNKRRDGNQIPSTTDTKSTGAKTSVAETLPGNGRAIVTDPSRSNPEFRI